MVCACWGRLRRPSSAVLASGVREGRPCRGGRRQGSGQVRSERAEMRELLRRDQDCSSRLWGRPELYKSGRGRVRVLGRKLLWSGDCRGKTLKWRRWRMATVQGKEGLAVAGDSGSKVHLRAISKVGWIGVGCLLRCGRWERGSQDSRPGSPWPIMRPWENQRQPENPASLRARWQWLPFLGGILLESFEGVSFCWPCPPHSTLPQLLPAAYTPLHRLFPLCGHSLALTCPPIGQCLYIPALFGQISLYAFFTEPCCFPHSVVTLLISQMHVWFVIPQWLEAAMKARKQQFWLL